MSAASFVRLNGGRYDTSHCVLVIALVCPWSAPFSQLFSVQLCCRGVNDQLSEYIPVCHHWFYIPVYNVICCAGSEADPTQA